MPRQRSAWHFTLFEVCLIATFVGVAVWNITPRTQVRQQILDYFTRHRYVVVGKYLRADDHNLYFTPLP